MITAKNLGLTIRDQVILEDVSFHIERGEYVGLIGPNGAGKTSLIKVILGFYKATTGSLSLDPKVSIGYVPQNYRLSGVVPISVGEVLRMSRVSDHNVLVNQLEKVALGAEFLSQNFHELSGGQKQRVIIARALCTGPGLLIFDEPLTGVDFETKTMIYDLLSNLNQKEKLTILFVSHEVDHIVSHCHHILCLNKTMHQGCHPLDFAQGKHHECDLFQTKRTLVPVHHHHDPDSSCSC